VRILLPPSEAKASGGRGRSLERRPVTGALGSALSQARGEVLGALARLLAVGDTAAVPALHLPPGPAAAALAANRAVLRSPTMPALRRYRGVVYDGLAFDALPAAAQRSAERTVLVFSGLWGVLRGGDPVPDYRVPAKAVLPGLGTAAAFWRPVLDRVLPAVLADDCVVDLRSADYAAMWRPRRASGLNLIGVRILSPLPDGRHAVVSYASKLAKGRLCAELVRLAAGGEPCTSASGVAAAWLACGGADARERAGGLDLYDGR
jgi:hypothetical protein